MEGPAHPAPSDPQTAPRHRWVPPRVVWWLAVYFVSWAVLALWATYITRAGGLPGAWLSTDDTALLHGVYALAWGCLGACVNGAVALGKHCVDRDFDERWELWYMARPPMGAVIGLVVYVLSKGLGTFLGMTATTTGFGVAAIAFVAGFATERVTRKIEEASKTLFALASAPPTLTVLEPASGQCVAGSHVRVAASVTGASSYLRATCLQEPAAPVDLTDGGDTYCEAVVMLSAPPGRKTIRVTGVVSGEVLTAEVTVDHRVGDAGPAASGAQDATDAPAGEESEP